MESKIETDVEIKKVVVVVVVSCKARFQGCTNAETPITTSTSLLFNYISTKLIGK